MEEFSELLKAMQERAIREVLDLTWLANKQTLIRRRLAEIEQDKTETETEIEQIKSDKDAVQAR